MAAAVQQFSYCSNGRTAAAQGDSPAQRTRPQAVGGRDCCIAPVLPQRVQHLRQAGTGLAARKVHRVRPGRRRSQVGPPAGPHTASAARLLAVVMSMQSSGTEHRRPRRGALATMSSDQACREPTTAARWWQAGVLLSNYDRNVGQAADPGVLERECRGASKAKCMEAWPGDLSAW